MAEDNITHLPTASGRAASPELQVVMGGALLELARFMDQFPHDLQSALIDSLVVSWCMNCANPDEGWGALREAIERDIAMAQRMSGAGGSA